jgi:hypothetical protein
MDSPDFGILKARWRVKLLKVNGLADGPVLALRTMTLVSRQHFFELHFASVK